MPVITLHINGAPRVVDIADPAMPLLFVLRDVLGLKGTKMGCTEGICGVCTLIVEGVAQRACQLPVGGLDGARVLTIEGLSAAGEHPVQAALIAADVPQCGYCQPAQVMRAAALLAETPRPDRATVAGAMAEVLCRCGTSARVVDAVLAASRSATIGLSGEARHG